MSALLGYVNNAINSGSRTVTVPPEIVAQSSEEELEEARKLSRAVVSILAGQREGGTIDRRKRLDQFLSTGSPA